MSRKHNHRMATRSLRLHPLERQRLRQVWSERTVNAGIHALATDDAQVVMAKVGTLLYVVLGAALLENLDQDAPDMRILRAAANVLGDLVGTEKLTHLQQATMSSALEALKRVVAALPEESLFIAASQAKRILAAGPVTQADFHAIDPGRPNVQGL